MTVEVESGYYSFRITYMTKCGTVHVEYQEAAIYDARDLAIHMTGLKNIFDKRSKNGKCVISRQYVRTLDKINDNDYLE